MENTPPVDPGTPALGWHDSHGASAALVASDGRIVFAAAEERYSRKKLQKGFPMFAMEDLRRRCPCAEAPVCYTDLPLAAKVSRHAGLLWHSFRRGRNTGHDALRGVRTMVRRVRRGRWNGIAGVEIDPDTDARDGATDWHRRVAGPAPITRPPFDTLCEHHAAHAASAYYCSGFTDAVVLTVDGVGDCLSGTLHRAAAGRLKRTHQFYYNELTVGADYEVITALLGFDPDRHCGKITGLAAYGSYDESCASGVGAFLDASWRRGARNYFDRLHGPDKSATIAELRAARESVFAPFRREQLAFAIQHRTEQSILNLIRSHVPDASRTDIALAGGVFANVRVNQKVKELGFRNIFIQPAMDDSGLAIGAALHHQAATGALSSHRLPHVFLGPSYDEDRITDALNRAGARAERTAEMPSAVAALLAKGCVVARCEGAMEFGPRALGHRSILCDARDPRVNDWLNRRLRRTEFMPFAPSTLAEHADRYYRGCDGGRHAAEFMTITFDCTDLMKTHSPAVVHVDGTARPQLVTREADPGFHEILREYHGRTGIGSIVNTSFNMHESPIVNTPEDAIAAFRESRLDYLALGPFLLSRDRAFTRRRPRERRAPAHPLTPAAS